MNTISEWLKFHNIDKEVFNKIIEIGYVDKLPIELKKILFPLIRNTNYIDETFSENLNRKWKQKEILYSFFKLINNFKDEDINIIVSINQDENEEVPSAIALGVDSKVIIKEIILPQNNINSIILSQIGIYYRDFINKIGNWNLVIGGDIYKYQENPYILFIEERNIIKELEIYYKDVGLLSGYYIINSDGLIININNNSFLILNNHIMNNIIDSCDAKSDSELYNFINSNKYIDIKNRKELLQIGPNIKYLLTILNNISNENNMDLLSFLEKTYLHWR